MDTIFQLSFLLVVPFWGLMIFAPRWRWTKRIIGSPWIVAPAAALYVILILPNIGDIFADLLNPTLDNVATLLGQPEGATIGWIHFLAFDLFVGRWAYLDGRARETNAWLMAPILFFVLMLGPFGLLLYLGVRRLSSSKRQPKSRVNR